MRAGTNWIPHQAEACKSGLHQACTGPHLLHLDLLIPAAVGHELRALGVANSLSLLLGRPGGVDGEDVAQRGSISRSAQVCSMHEQPSGSLFRTLRQQLHARSRRAHRRQQRLPVALQMNTKRSRQPAERQPHASSYSRVLLATTHSSGTPTSCCGSCPSSLTPQCL